LKRHISTLSFHNIAHFKLIQVLQIIKVLTLSPCLAGMSETSFEPKFYLVKSHTADKKNSALPNSCIVPQAKVPLRPKNFGFKVLV
jgi:hypothetical protein